MITSGVIRAKAQKAIKHFWASRARQTRRQGSKSGIKDTGNRSAVTGGKQLDGFVNAVAEIVAEAGIDKPSVFFDGRKSTNLPGFFRAEKNWDLLVVSGDQLLACIEFKSQVGSFGNNFNNRCEEAIGNAHDFWTAYREGAFGGSPRPWLGYLMLLEDAPGSRRAVRVYEPHFQVFPEFRDASYAVRYELFMLRLHRERMYDGAALLLSNSEIGKRGGYSEPNQEVGFNTFARSLFAHIASHADEMA